MKWREKNNSDKKKQEGSRYFVFLINFNTLAITQNHYDSY